MRQAFHHYFHPTDEELQALWQGGLFSFDASVLLNIYGYSAETRDELLRLIEQNAGRVCLPYQFGLEYARNRSNVIGKQASNYQRAENALEEIRKLSTEPTRDHPYLSRESLVALSAIKAELAERRKSIEKLIKSDPYAEKILAVFAGRVGALPTAEQLSQLHSDAKERYDQRIPPGYSDLKRKGVPDAYGDLIGWLQLIEIAKTEQRDVILVVDDFKEDWWRMERGEPNGPRPELREEFARVTGRRIHIYTSEDFLWAARKYVAADIRDDVIEEVSQRLADQRESGRLAADKPKSLEAESQKPAEGIVGNEDKPTWFAKSVPDVTAGETEKPNSEVRGGE